MKPIHANLHPSCPGDSDTAAASWSAVAEMRGRSLASATPLSSVAKHAMAPSARDSGVAPRLATALHDAVATFVLST